MGILLAPLAADPLAQGRSPVTDPAGGLSRARERTVQGASGPSALPFDLLLPDGGGVRVRLERFASTRPGGFTALGSLADGTPGYAAFAVQDDAFVGVVRVRGELYRVARAADGAPVLVREDPGGAPPCETEDVPVAPSTTGQSQARGTQPSRATTPGPLRPTFASQVPSSDGDTIVDLLVCWTHEAAVAAGGQATIKAIMDLAVLETNMAFDQSAVDLFLRVVHFQGLSYVESGSMATDLTRLRLPADGYMDNVHVLRDTYGADAVSLLVANDSACGRSYNMGSPPSSAFAPFAFSLVFQGCATGYFGLGHELGHGFGLNHDRPTATGVPSYPYAYGYWSADDTHRTIMALERPGNFGVRVPYFSNPNVTYQGFPLGIAEPDPDPANCARALNDNAGIIASWRPTQTP